MGVHYLRNIIGTPCSACLVPVYRRNVSGVFTSPPPTRIATGRRTSAHLATYQWESDHWLQRTYDCPGVHTKEVSLLFRRRLRSSCVPHFTVACVNTCRSLPACHQLPLKIDTVANATDIITVRISFMSVCEAVLSGLLTCTAVSSRILLEILQFLHCSHYYNESKVELAYMLSLSFAVSFLSDLVWNLMLPELMGFDVWELLWPQWQFCAYDELNGNRFSEGHHLIHF
jgi:hypothetical protein